MSISRDTAISWLVVATGFAWPLGQLGYLPVLQLHVLGILTAALALVLVIDLIDGEKLRVPFEVLAPSALIVVALFVDALLQENANRFRLSVGAIALGLATAHLARDAELIRRTLWATTLAAFAVTCLTLLRPVIGIMPTAYSLYGDVTLTFARRLNEGFLVLTLCGVIAVYVVLERRYVPVQRLIALATSIAIAGLLGTRMIAWIRETESVPVATADIPRPAEGVALVLLFWLFARILAKARLSSVDRGLTALWTGLACILLVYITLSPVSTGIWSGWLPGLALASSLPAKSVAWPRVKPYPIASVLVTVVIVNLLWIDPDNARDARQYDAGARRDFVDGRFGSVLARMDRIESYRRQETRTDLWRARVALATGHFNWASFAFRDALQPVDGNTLLPPPTVTEEQDFLVLIRDALSTGVDVDEVCAYERALLARGEMDAAVYSLKVRSGIPLAHSEIDLVTSLADVAAMVVGENALVSEFRTWENDELLTLLVQWGAIVDRGSNESLLLAAQRDLRILHVYARSAHRVARVEVPLPRSGPSDLERLMPRSRLYWEHASSDGPNVVEVYRLNARLASGIDQIGLLTVYPDRDPKFEPSPNLRTVPYLPALRFRVPE